MSKIYERNLQAIKKGAFLSDKDMDKVKISKNVSFMKDMHDNLIPCITKDGYTYALSSKVDAEKSSECLSLFFDEIKPMETYCIFGIGDGRAAGKFLDRLYDNDILILIEPDIEVLRTNMEKFDYSGFLNKKNCIIVAGKKQIMSELGQVIGSSINAGMKTAIRYLISPCYDVIFNEECRKCIDTIDYVIKTFIYSRNTSIYMNSSTNVNIVHNIPYFAKRSDLYTLIKRIKKQKINKYPAILVSAGPSLDKNIADLKLADKKAFIVVVDSALKTMAFNGINYQIGYTIDALKPFSVFDDTTVLSKPIIATVVSSAEVVKNCNNIIFDFADGYVIGNSLLKDYSSHDLLASESGGSVSTSAFSFLLMAGFKTIILVGQDLAFTGGVGHAQGFALQETAEQVKQRSTCTVEGWDGSELSTDHQMKFYLEWFENKIQEISKKVTVVNATEGGARINGSVLMTLKDAISKYCTGVMDLDVAISNLPRSLNKKQTIECENSLKELPKKLTIFSKKLTKYENAYRKMNEFIKEGVTKTDDFNKVYRIVSKANKMEQNEPLYNFVTLFGQKSDYSFKDIVMDIEKPMEEVLLSAADYMARLKENIVEIIKLIKKYW